MLVLLLEVASGFLRFMSCRVCNSICSLICWISVFSSSVIAFEGRELWCVNACWICSSACSLILFHWSLIISQFFMPHSVICSSQALANMKSLVFGTRGLMLGLSPLGGSLRSIADCRSSTWCLALVTDLWFLLIILRVFWCSGLIFLDLPKVVVDVELSIPLCSGGWFVWYSGLFTIVVTLFNPWLLAIGCWSVLIPLDVWLLYPCEVCLACIFCVFLNVGYCLTIGSIMIRGTGIDRKLLYVEVRNDWVYLLIISFFWQYPIA